MRQAIAAFLLYTALQFACTSPAHAAIAYVSANSASVASGTTLSVTKPTGTVSGHVMIAAITARPNTATITAPSGWTLIATITQTADAASPNRLSTYYKAAGASEPSSYTWTFSASVDGAVGGILTFSGVLTTSPVNVSGSNTTTTLTSTANAITTTVANTMLISVHEVPSSLGFSPPSGMTEVVDRTSLTAPDDIGMMLGMNYVAQSSIGSTGAKTATASPTIFGDTIAGTTQLIALRPSTFAAYSIDVGTGTGSTCATKSITITAVDSAGATVTSYTGTMTLSTSTGKGDWSLTTGNGTFSNGTADDGTASYTFVAADNGVVTLGLTEKLAQQVTITASDSSASVSTTSSTISFSDNTFVFTEDLSNKISGSDVAVAGRAHDYQVTLYRRDTSLTPANCSVATSYAGSKSLKAWITRNASDPGGAAPSIGAVSLGNSLPGSNNLSLTFTSGVATFSLTTTDVGKYAINFRDDTTASLTAAITGSSNTLTVRPFVIVISAIARGATANPATTSATGTVFTQAGENFQATVGGYRHSSTADTNDDGLLDAAATLAQSTAGELAPSYAYATTLSATSPIYPTGGAVGTLSNGSLTAGVFSTGNSTPTTLNYSEVGSFTLAGSVTSYLGTAGVDLTATTFTSAGTQNAVVGRFTPYDFGLSFNTPAFTPGCATTTAFTYVGQPFSYGTAPVITVTARNKAGATTLNYTGSWWKISNSTLTGRAYTAASGTVDVSGLPATTSDPVIAETSGSPGRGTLTFSSGSGLKFTRSALVAPFDADISLAINVIDSDGITYASNPARFGTASSGNGISFSSSGKAMRWGRLKLSNALGTEFANLSLPVEAQYYNGTSFITNTADGCTSFAKSAVMFSNWKRNLAACETFLSTTTATVTLTSGKASLTLTKPGAGNTGSVDLTPGLATSDSGTSCVSATSSATAGTANGVSLSHLQSNWDPLAPTQYNRNPSGRAVFGVPNVPKELIFRRENY